MNNKISVCAKIKKSVTPSNRRGDIMYSVVWTHSFAILDASEVPWCYLNEMACQVLQLPDMPTSAVASKLSAAMVHFDTWLPMKFEDKHSRLWRLPRIWAVKHAWEPKLLDGFCVVSPLCELQLNIPWKSQRSCMWVQALMVLLSGCHRRSDMKAPDLYIAYVNSISYVSHPKATWSRQSTNGTSFRISPIGSTLSWFWLDWLTLDSWYGRVLRGRSSNMRADPAFQLLCDTRMISHVRFGRWFDYFV